MARFLLAHCNLLAAIALSLSGCSSTPSAPDPATFAALAEASLPREGLTREMLKAMGEVARQGTLTLVLAELGRERGYDDTWAPGNRYYDRAMRLVEDTMEPVLSRLDPTPLLEQNLTLSLQRHLKAAEARDLVAIFSSPQGKRFTEYMDATMASSMLSGITDKTPAAFRPLMAAHLEPLRPRLAAARDRSQLSDLERARLDAFTHSSLGRKLGSAYVAWAKSLRGQWSADLRPHTQQVKENLRRAADDLRAILHEYELWRSGELRDA